MSQERSSPTVRSSPTMDEMGETWLVIQRRLSAYV